MLFEGRHLLTETESTEGRAILFEVQDLLYVRELMLYIHVCVNLVFERKRISHTILHLPKVKECKFKLGTSELLKVRERSLYEVHYLLKVRECCMKAGHSAYTVVPGGVSPQQWKPSQV